MGSRVRAAAGVDLFVIVELRGQLNFGWVDPNFRGGGTPRTLTVPQKRTPSLSYPTKPRQAKTRYLGG